MNNPSSIELQDRENDMKGTAVQVNVKPPISFRPSPEEEESSKQLQQHQSEYFSSSSTTISEDGSSSHSNCGDESCSTDHSHTGTKHRKKKKEGRLDYRRLTAANGGVFGTTIRVFQVFNICFYFYVGCLCQSDVSRGLR